MGEHLIISCHTEQHWLLADRPRRSQRFSCREQTLGTDLCWPGGVGQPLGRTLAAGETWAVLFPVVSVPQSRCCLCPVGFFGDRRVTSRSWHLCLSWEAFHKPFTCHIQQIAEESEDYYLLSAPDFKQTLLSPVICFRLYSGNTEAKCRRLNLVINWITFVLSVAMNIVLRTLKIHYKVAKH